jgi:predicted hydrocarbon binding protein
MSTSTIGDSIRPDLGEFMSLVCFKAALAGVEDTLGDEATWVVFTRAGKVRGHAVAKAAGIAGKAMSLSDLTSTLNGVFGKQGTRLCSVVGAAQDGDVVMIDTRDTICSAGEPQGSDRVCTYTLGAIWGAVEAVMGKTYTAKHTDSVLRGGNVDRFVFTPI